MSWFDNLKKWFWGDLKPELQEDLGMAGEEPIKRAQPKEITTTDEVLEAAVQKTLEKEPEVKKRKPRKKPAAKKPAEKKPRKPRKKKESNAD
tara:strand:- start:241 stop:516 length:276 start_codon:yes stop_codon:yes gene_type:complete